MDTTVGIRPAQAGDADAVAQIWYRGWQDAHVGNVPDDLVAARTKESFWERAAERIADTSDTSVATVDDVVAGFVMVHGDEVEQVYVSADHRGSGIAVTLLAAAEQHVAANGHEKAWLAVAPGNARARRFYERNGWTDEGYFEHSAPHGESTIAVPCHRYVKNVG